jgi:Coenzyme PQQ synthesis protein D (PqqD)
MRVQIGQEAIWRELDDEVVILNVETGVYFGLNGSGRQFWLELVEHGSMERALASLQEKFDVEPNQLRQDFEGIVRQLADKQLVRLVAETNGSSKKK